MHKHVKKKMHFTLQLMIHLTVQSGGAAEGTFDGPPKDALRYFHKDAHKGAFEVALKGVLGVALVLHLGLYLLMQ